MAKATKTIRQALGYKPAHAAWFAATKDLFNQVTAFYFEVIQAHERVLDLSNKDALTVLETLTHATRKNPTPVMPLEAIVEDIPAMFRRAAIQAALGSARSFYSLLRKWKKRKEKAEAKGKKFTERPPVPPRSWNKPATLYAGQWKERTKSSIVLKLWTGTCWSWIKVCITGRELPADVEMGSPSLIWRGKHWWLHTPLEKRFAGPGKIEQQGRIARNRGKTGMIVEGEQDNAALWRKINNVDESISHLVSARIVQFAKEHGATILVFEYLGNLKPEKGKYSRRGNRKRAFWMKGRIFTYAKYKAYSEGLLTSRVNPRNTSRECARCHSLVARYKEGQPAEGYTAGAPLVLCPQCGMHGNADRNASLVIGQCLVKRYQNPLQGKPQAPLRVERAEKSAGVAVCQDAKCEEEPSLPPARHADCNEHGTAQDVLFRMDEHISDIPHPLRLPFE
jgi:putative transposase